MKTGMANFVDSLSVLVVDEAAEVLCFFAKVLNAHGMRTLLASTPEEAISIGKRGYVPIDLVVTDVLIRPDPATPDLVSGHDLVVRLREIRPEVRALFMSASVESEVVRIELMGSGFQTTSRNSDGEGLIESIRAAATAPHVQRMGSAPATATGRSRVS